MKTEAKYIFRTSDFAHKKGKTVSTPNFSPRDPDRSRSGLEVEPLTPFMCRNCGWILFLMATLFLSGASTDGYAESIWRKMGNNEKGMFADKRASRVGDILTVLVEESSRMVNSRRTKTEKKSAINNKVT